MYKKSLYIGLFIFAILLFINANAEIENEAAEESEELAEEEISIVYTTPKDPPNAFIVETFDDIPAAEKRWVKSKAKKENVDEDISKYDGIWAFEEAEKDSFPGDRGLVLKSKAKHAAISSALKRPFVFKDKPFIVQYEVNLQNGQECGGAYIKLLSTVKEGLDLKNFHDKTPYTIMFGPDKCGNEHKLHFIFRHVNPINKGIEEKHCKRPKDKIEEPFKDKKPHLYTLIMRPDNTYEIMLDHVVINTGNLLEDFTPAVNPAKEIDDPADIKPIDWDEREKIPDPEAAKPVDWDEEAPMQIVDSNAVKPEGWLDDEPELVPDPESVKPEDWDDEMDGEWEAPLVSNVKCEEAPGCGEWRAPVVQNPDYKGKWKAPMIDNPNYKGKWSPRKIPNPDFFEDLEPFKMTPIAAVGLELWSMSDGIYFDNFIITDSVTEAYQFAAETFDLKVAKMEKGQKGYFKQIIEFSNKNPWIYGVYVLLLAIPVVLVFVCCCAEDVKEDKDGERKKTDEPTEDDPHEEEKQSGVEAAAESKKGATKRSTLEEKTKDASEDEDDDAGEDEEDDAAEDDAAEDDDDEDVADEEADVSGENEEAEVEIPGNKAEKSDDDTRKSPRLRKVRKE